MIATNPNQPLAWDAETEDDARRAGGVDDRPAQSTEDGEDGEKATQKEVIEPRFANVFEWVDGYFIKLIRRRINPQAGKGLSWDERWWQYPEVVARLKALHQAWEKARADKDGSAMSAWWIHHFEPHLRVILDGETGPMSHATEDGTFSGHPRLGNAPAPAEVRDRLIGS